MSAKTQRERSLATAAKLGYPINQNLPLLDKQESPKSRDQAVTRLLCLFVVAVSAYGLDRHKALAWLQSESISNDLTDEEKRFLTKGDGDANRFAQSIEAIWALAWALGFIKELDFEKNCDDNFIDLFPRIRRGESGTALRAKAALRPWDEILAACDLAYCLHWGMGEAQIAGGKLPGKVPPYVITERRRALDWLISDEPWDEVSLDT
jgi:hypothetical protein